MTAPKVEIGKRYHRLTVIRLAGRCRLGNKHWIVKCDCDRIGEFIVAESSLRYGNTKSCGCWREEVGRKNITRARTIYHGHAVGRKTTPTYRSWQSMISRCRNKNSRHYPNYGARGIDVCEAWLKFDAFLADMGERPEGLSLEREDNNKGYSPSNCRWATRAEQNANRRRNVYVTIQGETLCFAQAAKKWNLATSHLRRLAKDKRITLQEAMEIVLENKCKKKF